MRYDTEKDAVRNLQILLRQLSYTDPDIIPPPIDAVFDTVTRDSLKSFQRKYRLKYRRYGGAVRFILCIGDPQHILGMDALRDPGDLQNIIMGKSAAEQYPFNISAVAADNALSEKFRELLCTPR